MASKQAHKLYADSSPFYADLFWKFGNTIPRKSADKVAGQHSTTVAQLVLDGDLYVTPTIDVEVGTLELVMALGY